jgi:glucose/arabinose dehydrogenase
MVFATPSQATVTGLTRVASGLSSPMFVTHAPGDRSRLFIAQRGSPSENSNSTASIRILDLNSGSLVAEPFLTITGVDNRGEGGLLGMAFHPDYETNGKFYVYITAGDSDASTFFSSYIREYTVSADPNVANASFTPVISWGQPQSNHNGGWIGFSPNDNYLYIASGDGGGGNDDDAGHTAGTGNAQDITNNRLGKMLRLDVNSDDFPADENRNYAIPSSNPFAGVDDMGNPIVGDDEIWAYGLRNPFRASFDRLSGDLWIGDVGQGAREEVDFQPADSAGGENYGWRLQEGSEPTPTPGIGGPCPGCIAPAYDYQRPNSDPNDPANQYRGTTVIGGYVYRGPDPSLQGQYFFLDRNAGVAGINYWMFDPDDPYGSVQNIDSMMIPNIGSASAPVSMGEDAVGNLYIAYFSGNVYRIATNELITGDYNADGDVNDDDIGEWRESFGMSGAGLAADGNRDGAVDAADFVIVQKNLGASVHNLPGAGGNQQAPEPAAALVLCQLLAACGLARRRISPTRHSPLVEINTAPEKLVLFGPAPLR